MNLLTASLPNDVRDGCRENSATRKDFDSAISVLDKAPDERECVKGRVFLAAGQDAREAEVDDLVERGKWVGSYVEGAMKDGLTVTSALKDTAAAVDVDGAIGAQDAEDKAVCAIRNGEIGVP